MFVATLFVVCAAILIDLCACCSCSAGSSFCGRNAKTLFVKITVEDQVDSFAFDLSTLTLLPAKCPIDDMFHGGCFDGGRDCEWRPVNATPADPSPTPTLGTGSCIMLTPRSGRSDAGASLYRCASGYGNRYVVGPPDNDTFSPNWIVRYMHDIHRYLSIIIINHNRTHPLRSVFSRCLGRVAAMKRSHITLWPTSSGL
jgi:hypothetical protein